MAKFGSDTVLYKSAAGFLVPAVITQHVTSAGVPENVAVASATHADIVLLNAAATKLYTVAKSSSGTFANATTSTWEPGRWAVPA